MSEYLDQSGASPLVTEERAKILKEIGQQSEQLKQAITEAPQELAEELEAPTQTYKIYLLKGKAGRPGIGMYERIDGSMPDFIDYGDLPYEQRITRLEFNFNSSDGERFAFGTMNDPNTVLSVGGIVFDPEISRKVNETIAAGRSGYERSRVTTYSNLSSNFCIRPDGEVETNIIIPDYIDDPRAQIITTVRGATRKMVKTGPATPKELAFMKEAFGRLTDIVNPGSESGQQEIGTQNTPRSQLPPKK